VSIPTALPASSATGASCSGAYGLNADSSGRYVTPGCAAAGSPSVVTFPPVVGLPTVSAPVVGAPAALPCQLYPSGSQPSTSTFGAPNYPGTPIPANAQVVPPRGALVGAPC
jgi:hypothetical protein